MNHHIRGLRVLRAGVVMGASLACLETLGAPAAYAQAAGSDSSIETVVVTAERRSQSLLDVPGAVSVLGGDQLSDLQINGTRDLLMEVPGMSLVSGGPSFVEEISMRGQGAGRNGFSETSTGLYENGSYMAGGGFNGRQLSQLNTFDVERIEILHGPQGALYGRNSVGGAINVIVNQPQPEFSAREQVQYGSPNDYGMQGIINAPIQLGSLEVDTRAGIFYEKQNAGFIRNLTTGDWVDTDSSFGARGGIVIHPSENSKLYAQFEYYDARQPSFGTLGYVANYRANTSNFNATDVLDPGPYAHNHLSREGRVNAPDITETVNYDNSLSFGDLSIKFYNRNRSAGRDNEDFDHYLGLPDFAALGTGGLTLPADMAQYQNENFHLYDTQATLASNGNGRWKWLVGGEMLYFSDDVTQGFDNCAPYDPSAKTAAQVQVYQENGTGGCVAGLLPSAAAYTVPSLFTADSAVLNVLRGQLAAKTQRNRITSYAAFATVSYDFNPQWTLAAEARLTTDRNDFLDAQYSQDPLSYWGTGAPPAGFAKPIAGEYCPPAVFDAGLCTGTAPGPYRVTDSQRWNEFLPGATLTYKVADAQTLYARFATGYRPGGFNDPTSAVQPAYEPEYTESGELGWKGSFFDLFDGDLSLYYQKTRNVQLVQYSQSASGGFVLQNVGKDHVYGYELNLTRTFMNVGPGSFRASASLSSNTGAFDDGTVILEKAPFGPLSLAGLRVPFTNDIQGSLDGAYTAPIGGYTLQFETNYQFSSGGPWNYAGANGILSTTNNPTRNSLNLFLRLFAPDDGWMVSVFGKNVTDYRYIAARVTQVQYWSQPATWGIVITAKQ